MDLSSKLKPQKKIEKAQDPSQMLFSPFLFPLTSGQALKNHHHHKKKRKLVTSGPIIHVSHGLRPLQEPPTLLWVWAPHIWFYSVFWPHPVGYAKSAKIFARARRGMHAWSLHITVQWYWLRDVSWSLWLWPSLSHESSEPLILKTISRATCWVWALKRPTYIWERVFAF